MPALVGLLGSVWQAPAEQEAEENVGTNGDHAVRAEDVSCLPPCCFTGMRVGRQHVF